MEQKQTCIRLYADRIQIDHCKTIVKNNEREFQSLSNLLSLTGNTVRLKILYLLNREGELCPCDLSDILEMSIPAVSQHLRKLKDGNLVTGRREGQTIFYSIIPAQLNLLEPIFYHINIKTRKETV